MQTQLDIPDELNKKIKMYKLENDLKTIQEATIIVLTKYFKNKEDTN